MGRFFHFAIAFALMLSAAFAGSLGAVFTDLSLNPIAGVAVSIYDSGNVLAAQVQSLADGSINVDGLSGHYTLYAQEDGYVTGHFTANVPETGHRDQGNLILVPTAALNTEAMNNLGQPIGNGVVKVIQNGDETVALAEGASHTFRLSPGNYDVIFGAPYHTQQSFSISLAPGDVQSLSSSLTETQVDTFPTVVSISVSLSDASVQAGDEVTLTATATYNDGHIETVTSAAGWNVGNSGTLYVPRLMATGAGTHDITASFGGKQGSAQLSVDAGAPVSMDLTSSRTTMYTGESAQLTSYLLDVHSNRVPSADVTYSTTCGSIQGSTFSSGTLCAATIKSVYNLDNAINDTVIVHVTQRDTGGGSTSGGTTRTTSTTTTTTDTPQAPQDSVPNEGAGMPTGEQADSLKLVMPASAYVGDKVEAYVLDQDSNPVAGIVMTLERPDGKSISLVSDIQGMVEFTAFLPGTYTLMSRDYPIIGANTITAREIPVAEQPEIPKPPKEQGDGLQAGGEQVQPEDRGIIGTLFAAFSGEISPVDAIKATLPLWLIIGAVLFAAAVFFVVYTFLAGAPIAPGDAGAKDGAQGQQVLVRDGSQHMGKTRQEMQVRETANPAVNAVPTVKDGDGASDAVGQASPKSEQRSGQEAGDEIGQLERELEEKVRRLKQLKEGRGGNAA